MARTRAQDFEEKSRSILDHAALVFAEQGMDKASMAQIAQQAQVSKALLYHYYPSKDALIFAIIMTHLEELQDAIEAADDPKDPQPGEERPSRGIICGAHNFEPDDLVVVSLPGVPDEETRRLIQASADMQFRPVLQSGPGEATPEDQRLPEDQLPKPDGEPADAYDPNWVTPALLAEFQATDCTAPRDPAAPPPPSDRAIVACQPSEELADGAVTPAQKYILGPVVIPGTQITGATNGLAPAQGGLHEDGRRTWGRSTVVGPWGEIIARADHDEPCVLYAKLDMGAVARARSAIPSLTHDRDFAPAR